MPMASTPVALPSAARLHLLPHGVFPMIGQLRKRRLGPGLLMVLYIVEAPPISGQLQHYNPILGKTLKDTGEGKSS